MKYINVREYSILDTISADITIANCYKEDDENIKEDYCHAFVTCWIDIGKDDLFPIQLPIQRYFYSETDALDAALKVAQLLVFDFSRIKSDILVIDGSNGKELYTIDLDEEVCGCCNRACDEY